MYTEDLIRIGREGGSNKTIPRKCPQLAFQCHLKIELHLPKESGLR